MDVLIYIIIFCMGTLFGSFFTLAVYRIPLGKDITHERSFCPNCNHKLTFFDMIPLLSYIFLKGKCRYCKQKIRPRYFLLELFTGIIFVLFAMSVKLDILNSSLNTWIYLGFGLLYLATLFIIAGIDKEKFQIQKSVLLFGFIVELIYIIYLYIVEKNFNIYRYVIYLVLIAIVLLIDTLILRKKLNNNYTTGCLLLCILIQVFTYETVTILTITFTILCILFNLLLKKLFIKRNKTIQKEEIKLPIGFYLCVTNIICLLVANYSIFNI